MNLRYITCSDIREHVKPHVAIDFLRQNPNAEFAIQAHPTKMSYGMPRNVWFNELVMDARNFSRPINLAVHVNVDWCDMLCRGQIPNELKDWLIATRPNGAPVIARWQINIVGAKTSHFDAKKIAQLINHYSNHEFIFQYTNNENARMKELDKMGAKFSVLYDASGGNGISPSCWYAPVFENHPNGYSGGLSPENVYENLNQISRVAGNRNDIWIDAEGKLKDPDTKQFDLVRARRFIDNTNRWLHKYSR